MSYVHLASHVSHGCVHGLWIVRLQASQISGASEAIPLRPFSKEKKIDRTDIGRVVAGHKSHKLLFATWLKLANSESREKVLGKLGMA